MRTISGTALRAGILAATLVAFTAPAFAQGAGGAGGSGGGANLPQTSGQPTAPGSANTGSMPGGQAGKLCPPGSPNAGQAKC